MKSRNQHEDVLEYMRTHKSITQIDCYTKFPAAITRLSAIIFNLRKAGHIIGDEFCTSDNCYGKTQFKRYFLISENTQNKSK